jgi:TetR/AcrR family transcriptional regulator
VPESPILTPRMPASDRRTQLLETALNVFSQKGFNGATTKEIAAAAGVTEAVIFRHFPTKQALYQAVLESETGCPGFHQWMAEAQACMDRNDDEALFAAIARVIIQSYSADARLERLFLFAALEGNEQGLAHYRSFSIPIYELLRVYIARRQREGVLADHEPGAILAAIAGMAQRYAMATQMFGFPSEVSPEKAVQNFTRILMDGIQARTI